MGQDAFSLTGMSRVFVVALGIVLVPTASAAEADRSIALGVGLHGTVHLGDGLDQGDGVGGGAQLRLKMFNILSLRVDYSFARQVEYDFARVTTLPDLVPYPDLRFALGIYPIPNKWFSPFFALGMGINTAVGFDTPVLLAGLGFETTLYKNWVIGANVQAYYATPGRIADFVAREALVNQQFSYSVGDFATPGALQIGLELSYYL